MRRALLFILLTLSYFASGQVIYGTVIDDAGNPISLCSVSDTVSNESTETDQVGVFILAISEKAVLSISHPNFETQLFEVEVGKDVSSMHDFVLENRVQLVDEVVVSSDRMKVVVDQKAVNVIDYLPFDNVILTLKSYKRQRILSIEGLDTTFISYPLGKIKPSSIFKDCFDNIHLLSQDSAYQIWMDSTIHIVSRSSIKEFNSVVKPCIADFTEAKIFENFTNRNKKYILTNIESTTKKRTNFLVVHDVVGEAVAREIYDSIIRRYFMVTPDYANIITAGAWSGDLMELVSLDAQLHYMIAWYLKIRATELKIQSFHSRDQLYTIDQYSDSVHVFDKTGNLLKSQSYSFYKSSRVFDVIQDRATGSFFEVILSNGVYSIKEIALESSAALRVIKLEEAPLCKNIQVHDDWVYFMVKQNDFYQVNRIYLGRNAQN